MVLNVAYLFHNYSYKLILISIFYCLNITNNTLVEFIFRNGIIILQEYKEKSTPGTLPGT